MNQLRQTIYLYCPSTVTYNVYNETSPSYYTSMTIANAVLTEENKTLKEQDGQRIPEVKRTYIAQLYGVDESNLTSKAWTEVRAVASTTRAEYIETIEYKKLGLYLYAVIKTRQVTKQ